MIPVDKNYELSSGRRVIELPMLERLCPMPSMEEFGLAAPSSVVAAASHAFDVFLNVELCSFS